MSTLDDAAERPTAPETPTRAGDDDDIVRRIDGALKPRTSVQFIERLLQQGRVADAVARAQRDGLPDAPTVFTRAARNYLRSGSPRLALALYDATCTPPPADVLRLYAALYRAEGEDDAAAVLDAWLVRG